MGSLMVRESELRNALEAVSENRLSVWEFAEWIDSKSWGMHRDGSKPEAIRLASSIDRVLAEYDNHHNESVLRRELGKLRNIIVVSDCRACGTRGRAVL